ncbi:uncharacterized protein BJ212DRAFT_846488 [Suillus subaureus]|uniref:Uncharacterized protein n=1 Tax=Suillus subaureus TaxID=48587 RepID=A0A9P7AP02_9AGAM|nr:uncharacterized protein BJ212DRAFT_846488 [Suillus subaureus]KAG1792389.1 hypothetical protein BJ212DRAFT_846488 [Suillus subaureus]
MTTQSCMISSIGSIIYLILYAMDNFVQYPFIAIQNQMQVIAPFVLILRIIQGQVWTRRTDVNTTDHSLQSGIEDFLPASASIVLVLVLLRHPPSYWLMEFHIINK